MPDQALAGVRVLDLARYLAGPYCAMLLGDMGAEVIRIEPPGGGDDRGVGPHFQGESLFVLAHSRGKKSITLDLRSEQGRQLFRQLVPTAHVVVENYRPGVMAAMQLSYDQLKQINPGIILVSISGFGQTGPYASRPAFDPVAQAYAGMVDLNGFPDSPPVKTAMSIADYAAGMYGALGAMFALYHGQRTGEGQHIDVSLLDSMVSFLETSVMEHVVLGHTLRRIGNRRPISSPTNAYRAEDAWVFLAATPNSQWLALLEVMGREDLADDPRFATYRSRGQHCEIIEQIVADWMAGVTAGHAVEKLVAAGIPCAPVNSVAQAVADPQIISRNMIVEVEHPIAGKIPVPGVVAKLSATPGTVGRPPLVGQHNDEIYGGLLGLDPAQIARLRADGAI